MFKTSLTKRRLLECAVFASAFGVTVAVVDIDAADIRRCTASDPRDRHAVLRTAANRTGGTGNVTDLTLTSRGNIVFKGVYIAEKSGAVSYHALGVADRFCKNGDVPYEGFVKPRKPDGTYWPR